MYALLAQRLHHGRLLGYARRLDNLVGGEYALHRVAALLVLHAPLLQHAAVALGYRPRIREKHIKALFLGQHGRTVSADSAAQYNYSFHRIYFLLCFLVYSSYSLAALPQAIISI